MKCSDKTLLESSCKRQMFGKRFRKAYNRLGMPRKEFCRLCGIYSGTLGAWLNGRSMPLDNGKIERIAEILRVSPEYLKGTQTQMLSRNVPKDGAGAGEEHPVWAATAPQGAGEGLPTESGAFDFGQPEKIRVWAELDEAHMRMLDLIAEAAGLTREQAASMLLRDETWRAGLPLALAQKEREAQE